MAMQDSSTTNKRHSLPIMYHSGCLLKTTLCIANKILPVLTKEFKYLGSHRCVCMDIRILEKKWSLFPNFKMRGGFWYVKLNNASLQQSQKAITVSCHYQRGIRMTHWKLFLPQDNLMHENRIYTTNERTMR